MTDSQAFFASFFETGSLPYRSGRVAGNRSSNVITAFGASASARRARRVMVNTHGRARLPPRPGFDITDCDLKPALTPRFATGTGGAGEPAKTPAPEPAASASTGHERRNMPVCKRHHPHRDAQRSVAQHSHHQAADVSEPGAYFCWTSRAWKYAVAAAFLSLPHEMGRS